MWQILVEEVLKFHVNKGIINKDTVMAPALCGKNILLKMTTPLHRKAVFLVKNITQKVNTRLQ